MPPSVSRAQSSILWKHSSTTEKKNYTHLSIQKSHVSCTNDQAQVKPSSCSKQCAFSSQSFKLGLSHSDRTNVDDSAKNRRNLVCIDKRNRRLWAGVQQLSKSYSRLELPGAVRIWAGIDKYCCPNRRVGKLRDVSNRNSWDC
uniref:Uncharacterized protein n=1 Tax=Romanomermis culicivorax TaxID=13658 RepID=A0A915JZC8_ROMCU